MRFNATSAARRCIIAIWFVLLAAIIGLVALARLAPLADHQVVVIRGGSMEPAIPLGALVAVRSGRTEEIAPGDVVTLRLRSDLLVTHRVLRVTTLPGGTYLATKGDANAVADPVLVPVESAVGVVDFVVPFLGFVVGFLSIPSGTVSVVCLLTSLLIATELLRDTRPARPRVRLATATHARGSGA